VDEDPYFAFEVDDLSVQRIVRSEHTPAVLVVEASLGRRRSFFFIFRANVFHDRELPR